MVEETNKINQFQKVKNWKKTWWGITILIGLSPFIALYWIWTKSNWDNSFKIIASIPLLILIIPAVIISGLFSYKINNPNKSFTSSNTISNITRTPSFTPEATSMPSLTQPQITQKPLLSDTSTPVPTKNYNQLLEDAQVASTPEGLELYKQIESDTNINGALYIEFEGDAIIDANPESQSVQLGLLYAYKGNLTPSIKQQIIEDFSTIKAKAEKNPKLIMSNTKKLRLFVLTFHDENGKSRGEVEQMYSDNSPQWSEWN